jgi:hypothetical protein
LIGGCDGFDFGWRVLCCDSFLCFDCDFVFPSLGFVPDLFAQDSSLSFPDFDFCQLFENISPDFFFSENLDFVKCFLALDFPFSSQGFAVFPSLGCLAFEVVCFQDSDFFVAFSGSGSSPFALSSLAHFPHLRTKMGRSGVLKISVAWEMQHELFQALSPVLVFPIDPISGSKMAYTCEKHRNIFDSDRLDTLNHSTRSPVSSSILAWFVESHSSFFCDFGEIHDDDDVVSLNLKNLTHSRKRKKTTKMRKTERESGGFVSRLTCQKNVPFLFPKPRFSPFFLQ